MECDLAVQQDAKRENLDRVRRENFVGAQSATWLRDIAKVLNRRFDPHGRDRPLISGRTAARRAASQTAARPERMGPRLHGMARRAEQNALNRRPLLRRTWCAGW